MYSTSSPEARRTRNVGYSRKYCLQMFFESFFDSQIIRHRRGSQRKSPSGKCTQPVLSMIQPGVVGERIDDVTAMRRRRPVGSSQVGYCGARRCRQLNVMTLSLYATRWGYMQLDVRSKSRHRQDFLWGCNFCLTKNLMTFF